VRRLLYRLLALALALLLGLVLAEVVLRLVAPQEYMYPRYEFSREYGLIPFADTAMLHTHRGHFRFTYTTNRKHHRGILPPVSNDYETENIVVLGDSYSFGMGVADGEEYPALLNGMLDERYAVINLAAPGWGLTQQIRRYYELGQLYAPSMVILQFCGNDVEDNLANPVTLVEEDRFLFQDSPSRLNTVKKYLSRSPIQRLHLYNLVRNDLFEVLNRQVTRRTAEILAPAAPRSEDVPVGEALYIQLLDLFARDLTLKNKQLLVIAVNHNLEDFPQIADFLRKRTAENQLRYLDVIPWFEGLEMHEFGSPEGHPWGRLGHEIIAEGLVEAIQKLNSE